MITEGQLRVNICLLLMVASLSLAVALSLALCVVNFYVAQFCSCNLVAKPVVPIPNTNNLISRCRSLCTF